MDRPLEMTRLRHPRPGPRSPRDTGPSLGRWACALLGLVALTLAVAPARASAASFEAETMSLPSSSGRVFSDRNAGGGKALLISRTAAASRSFTAPAAAAVAVRARGDQCGGAPRMVVWIDGVKRLSRSVSATSWTGYRTDVAIPAGGHRVKISFTNDWRTSTCDRNLRVDRVRFVEVAAAPTPAPEPPTVPEPSAKATTRPVGEPPLGDREAATRVARSPWEPRPENTAANQRRPTESELAEFYSAPPEQPYTRYVTGGFSGTTDELIRWAAWKWGVDEDVLRAVAVQESDWHQSMLGDYVNGAPTSFGITQIKDQWHDPGHPGTYPLSQESTAFNLDYYGRAFRSCFDGQEMWLETVSGNGRPYAAGELWGCVGLWYSGRWHDSGAEDYIAKIKAHLANRTWTSY